MSKLNLNLNSQHPLMLAGLLLLASLCRFIPHPPNFTPVIAIALLSVACFKQRYLQFGFPLIIMLATDAVLGFHRLMPVVYISLLLAGLSGYIFNYKASFSRMLGSSLLASIIFFTLSNFGVWIYSASYAKSWAGLMSCYTLALPFFHNTVLATVGTVMGIYALLRLSSKIGHHDAIKAKL
eukprot:COSAG01_NODE_5139_length_4460_cov_2.397386_3_plen_181_part_00